MWLKLGSLHQMLARVWGNRTVFCLWVSKMVYSSWKTFWQFLKMFESSPSLRCVISTSRYFPGEKWKHLSYLSKKKKKNVYVNVCGSWKLINRISKWETAQISLNRRIVKLIYLYNEIQLAMTWKNLRNIVLSERR